MQKSARPSVLYVYTLKATYEERNIDLPFYIYTNYRLQG